MVPHVGPKYPHTINIPRCCCVIILTHTSHCTLLSRLQSVGPATTTPWLLCMACLPPASRPAWETRPKYAVSKTNRCFLEFKVSPSSAAIPDSALIEKVSEAVVDREGGMA